MKTIELFSGTKSFSKVAKQKGYDTKTIDNDERMNPDVCEDVMNLEDELSTEGIDFLWCSPPCASFSIASVGKHWLKEHNDYTPKTDAAIKSLEILRKTIRIIKKTRPRKWYIENPRAMMRKIIDTMFKQEGVSDYHRVTVTYCQYGDTRMKPTDIWTNDYDWRPRPHCKRGDGCHESAPRGSKTGTLGIKSAKDRGRIPHQIFEEIFEHDKGDK